MSESASAYRVLAGGNGSGHICTEQHAIHKLQGDVAELRPLLDHILREIKGNREDTADLIVDVKELKARVGSPDNDPTMTGTGLTGAVAKIANRQLMIDRDMNSIRPRMESVEEITLIQTRDELINRTHASEADLKAARAELSRIQSKQWNLLTKIVLAVIGTGGIAGIVKLIFEAVK